MPKARQTCTRCSMRRQKCDRKDPCTRCVKNNEGSSCSRQWLDGYEPRIHRNYPKSRAATRTIPLESSSDGAVREDEARDTSLTQNTTTTQLSFSPQPNFQGITNLANNEYFPSTATFINHTRPAVSVDPRSSQAENERNFAECPVNETVTPSNLDAVSGRSHNRCFSAGNSGHLSGQSHSEHSPRNIEEDYLQTLMPTGRQILQLVKYHEAYLLWYHNCFHGPTFRNELVKALQTSDILQLKSLDLRWCALLFSIMAASLACTSDSVACSWGFPKAQKRQLSKQWNEATTSCLTLGDYMSKPHIYSIQAIQVLGMSAHLNGNSNKQFVLFGVALRIAQNLGLQRLSQDPELDCFTTDGAEKSESRINLLIKRETGRRIWIQMCNQDWFSTPSSEMYFINKQHFTTTRPHRIDDETMMLVDDSIPLGIDLGNYLYDTASLLVEFHDSIITLVDPAAKYEQVLKYDARLRVLGTRAPHQSFSANVTDGSKPQWAQWMRGLSSTLYEHKIMMIHRSFLGKSFIDPRFAYTRWASLAASKRILREVELASADVERPAFWCEQAHLVGAGITLCLDILHRSEAEPEFAEHWKLVDQAISLLGRHNDSTLASCGVQLLSSLLKEATTKQLPPKQCAHRNSNKKALGGDPVTWPLESRRNIEEIGAINQPNSGDDGGLSTEETTVNTRRKTRRGDSSVSPITGGFGVNNDPVQQRDEFNFTSTDINLGANNDFGALSDLSWTDLFSDYFASQNGIENTFLIEDPLV